MLLKIEKHPVYKTTIMQIKKFHRYVYNKLYKSLVYTVKIIYNLKKKYTKVLYYFKN